MFLLVCNCVRAKGTASQSIYQTWSVSDLDINWKKPHNSNLLAQLLKK